MITDPRVFHDEYLPRELKYREGPVEEICRAFDPAVDGDQATDVLVAGPSGVGKTVLVRHTLNRLEQYADVDHAHIECLGADTEDVLQAALRKHRTPVDIYDDAGVKDLRDQLRETIRQPYILVLDEADALPDTGILDDIIDIAGVSIVGICHDQERWLARVSDDVRRRLAAPVRLERYGVSELSSILRDRADQGLRRDAVDDAHLRTIANEVAGVARYGIQALRAAAEFASDRSHGRIQKIDVADSFDRARRRIRRSSLDSLPFHHHLLYGLIHQSGKLSASALHEHYEMIAEEVYFGRDLTPIGGRARRNKLSKLREYDLIDCQGPPQNRRYYVLDESISPPVTLPSLNQHAPE